MQRASILLCLGLAACGASSNSSGTSHANTATAGTTEGAAPGSDMECHDETPTGSSISHQVCRSKFQSDQDRKGAQDMLGAPRTAAGRPGN
jgi:hypothetical protein